MPHDAGMRPLALALICLPALPLGGCCSIARAWCGPDRTPWVSVDFHTPELAARTLLEALRRDEPAVVYDALSDELRAGLGVDGMAIEIAWPKIKAQFPYLHVAGYAAVPDAEVAPGGDAAALTVAVEGQRLRLDLVRQTYWELRYRRPGSDLTPAQREARVGRRLDGLADAVRIELDVEAEDDRSSVSLTPQSAAHFGVDEIPVENVEALGVFHQWKVRKLTLLDG